MKHLSNLNFDQQFSYPLYLLYMSIRLCSTFLFLVAVKWMVALLRKRRLIFLSNAFCVGCLVLESSGVWVEIFNSTVSVLGPSVLNFLYYGFCLGNNYVCSIL